MTQKDATQIFDTLKYWPRFSQIGLSHVDKIKQTAKRTS